MTTDYVGKTFVFDYGALVIEVRYVAANRLEWKQLQGPETGLTGTETYHAVPIRPEVHFVSWQEKDRSVVSQVVDFERRKVYTAWSSPKAGLSNFEGSIR
jgi:hypothetical protein